MIENQKRALVIGASGGIGSAMVETLSKTHEVVALSRSRDGLDLGREATIIAAAEHVDGPFDLILVATGGLEIDGVGPEKTVDALSHSAMAAQFTLNAIGPALCLKHFRNKLRRDGRSVFACLSARVGSIGDNRLGGWTSYRAAKAALNQVIRTTAIEVGRKRPEAIVVALHPGTVQTDLTQKYLGRHPAVPPLEAAGNIVSVLDGLSSDDTGGFFDWRGDRIPW